MSQPTSRQPPHRQQHLQRVRRVAYYATAVLLIYVLIAYFAMPIFWRTYVWRHPSLDDVPRITYTSAGIPGDPLNVELIGTEEQVHAIMQAAGWFPAAELGVRSDLRIAADTVLHRPYDEAPVSRLFLFGREEDLACEKPVGHDPSKRNHVRLWRLDKTDPDGRPVWIGAATFDAHTGLSHTTGQITHHIAADVDAERDNLFHDLHLTGMLNEEYFVDDFHTIREGRNGGGDPWHTDGRLRVGDIKAE